MNQKPGTRGDNADRSPATEAALAEMFREQAAAEQRRPAIRAAGVDALKRLLTIARGDSGQCRYVAGFLLSLYNGHRFKFDLTDFRALDPAIFHDCLAVLEMDQAPEQEVHRYIEGGQAIWEQLARDWNIPDYMHAHFDEQAPA